MHSNRVPPLHDVVALPLPLLLPHIADRIQSGLVDLVMTPITPDSRMLVVDHVETRERLVIVIPYVDVFFAGLFDEPVSLPLILWQADHLSRRHVEAIGPDLLGQTHSAVADAE